VKDFASVDIVGSSETEVSFTIDSGKEIEKNLEKISALLKNKL
jgi:hypothetical protein